MEFNVTTFVLEIINFFALLWILKVLLYKPINQMIKERQDKLNATIRQSEEKLDEAKKLENEYQKLMRAWEQEKKKRDIELEEEIREKRENKLIEIDREIKEREETSKVLEEKKIAEKIELIEKRSVQQSYLFTSKLLQEVACPEVETQIISMLLKKIQEDKTMQQKIQEAQEKKITITIKSRYEISSSLKSQFKSLLKDNEIHFLQDSSLISGVEVILDQYLIQANLRDELNFFWNYSQV